MRWPVIVGVVCALVAASTARAQLRVCERRSETCWACADVEAGISIPCGEEASCGTEEICVERDGTAECHASSTVCCPDGDPCAQPPGCDGAAVACATPADSSEPEHCTFLSRCPDPLPFPDAGVPSDAGPSDAGAPDANVGGLDAAIADAGRDAATERDAGARAMDASGEPVRVSFHGGGGLRCSAGAAGSPSWLALVVVLLVLRRCRRT